MVVPNCPGCKERQRMLRAAQIAIREGDYAEAQNKMREMAVHAADDVLSRIRRVLPGAAIERGDDK